MSRHWRAPFRVEPWIEERSDGFYACAVPGDYIVWHGPYRWWLSAWIKTLRLR